MRPTVRFRLTSFAVFHHSQFLTKYLSEATGIEWPLWLGGRVAFVGRDASIPNVAKPVEPVIILRTRRNRQSQNRRWPS